jgi:hypothetical protein
MKLNSPAALKLGRELLNQYGDWAAMDKAGQRRSDGVIVIPRKPNSAPTAPSSQAASNSKKK